MSADCYCRPVVFVVDATLFVGWWNQTVCGHCVCVCVCVCGGADTLMEAMLQERVRVVWANTQYSVRPSDDILRLYRDPSLFEPLHMELRTAERTLSEFGSVLKSHGGADKVKAFAKKIAEQVPRLSTELATWQRGNCRGHVPSFGIPCCVVCCCC